MVQRFMREDFAESAAGRFGGFSYRKPERSFKPAPDADYRRITGISQANGLFNVTIHVYSNEKAMAATPTDVLADPELYRPRAVISTLIGR